ncbi:P-loop containing nucleoside triphosphate hydrolase protein [Gautieria morchelliformis]|nr:P-loop containing nucleoside triphosphate hydrolase protein [Gautieria morchelliformis]
MDEEKIISTKQKHDSTLTPGFSDEENDRRGKDVGEEGGEGGGEGEDGDQNGSPNGRKRARINEAGDAISVKKEEKVKLPRRVTLSRDRDGYVPGSIVRVQLENFVTYDFVEFRPGPNLNMIFGPNGTGKSSIACALCIGLNGAPSLLGRSTELNAFVKHGHDTGYVELELKGKVGKPNLVIRRSINSKNRSSNFTFNGTAVTGREINERITELNVQVGNLCSFLPQDRVSEFAQMSPQQLLKETQRTAGDENLVVWHTTLIDKGKELKIAQTVLQDEQKQRVRLEEKQQALERDVERYHERRAIETEIEICELALPYVQYKESKERYNQAKLERDRAAAEYRQMEEQNKPMKLLQTCADLSTYHKERRTRKDRIKNYYSKTMSSITSRTKQAVCASRADEALEKIKAIKRSEKDLARNKARTREEIAKLQEQVDNAPEYEAINPLNEELKAIKSSVGTLKVKRAELGNRIGELVHKSSQNDRTIQEKQHELREQDNQLNRKISSLRNWDRDCAEVIVWFLKNKESNEFARRVDLPAVVGVTVRDKKYVDAVESCFNANQLKTFVTHSEADYITFNRLFIDTPEALGHKVRVTVWYRPQNMDQLLKPPLATEELHSIGFDNYAIDLVDCPNGLKWFLVKELNMHRTPIALDPRKVDDAKVQAALSRLGPDGRSPPGASYISGNTLAMVSRSAYGQQKTMTVTRSIRPAKNFVHPTIDPAVKRAIDEQIAQAQHGNDELKLKMAELKTEDQALLGEIESLQPRHQELVTRRDAAKKTEDTIKANKARLGSTKKKLEDYENQPSPAEERQRHNAIVEKSVKERSKALAELVGLIKQTIQDQSSLAEISLRQIQLAADVNAIDELCDERTAEAKRIKQAYGEATELFEALRSESIKKKGVVENKISSISNELGAEFRRREEEDPADRWTSETVAAALETEQAKLDLNHATDAGVIQTYEKRKLELENLTASVENKEKKARKLEEGIQKTRDLWYPALTSLVTAIGEKFSAAFDRINCAGEIRVAEDEDYEKWAIEIFVKFREGEPLTQLTGQRQSGGERSLTTILYLMSLTEHARAPFSLVDEINQGMDQRYERAVHDQLVEVTCKAESGQYFLITPKLLPGLQYHQSMKILCVNNGEWLPESTEPGVGNMQRMIKNFLEHRRA